MNKQRKTSHILNVFQYDETTGAVTLPSSLSLATPDSTDNSTKVATTAWIRAYVGSLSYATASSVTTAIANLVASAPTTLDTLNELATALGNDPNFATTITTSIGTKVPQSRTITINGTAYDLSADRAWTIASGVTSFNTRTGAITLTSGDVTGALGYTPYNATNPSGYITGITSGMVTGALGYTPYNSSNPSGYITSSALTSYLPLSGGTMTGQIVGPSVNTGVYGGLIQIREQGYVSNGQSAWDYAPAITFHWGNRFATKVGCDSSGYLAIDNIRFLNASNYNSYSPTLTGGGASGTWGISVSGNAATATNSSQLNGWGYTSYAYRSSGTGYYQVNDWIQMNTSAGIYWPSYYGLHLEPNGSSYGSLRVRGSKNGWSGINFSDSNTTIMVNAGESGFHNDNYSWQFRWTNGTLYCHRSTYGGGTSYTVWDSGNLTNLNQLSNGPGYQTNSGQVNNLSTNYAGGVQSNPQVYFNNGIGLKVAMTGHWSVWSDTLWVNGYAGGDVPWMCALHFLRNSEPRFAISAQTQGSGSYGSIYEVITSYNIANQTVSTANNLSGFNKTNPSFGQVYASDWFRAQGNAGFYTQDYGGHLRRSLGSSFGNWETFGYERNGWSGFCYVHNYLLNIMSNTSGDHGFYQENGNGWTLFYNRGNNCWGIGTDNTYSGDGFRCVKYGSSQYGWTTWSDRRAKENITSITGALDKVLNMRGVYFNYISDDAKTQRVGFIAQELEQVLPEAVRYAEEIDEYNVEYAQIVSVLTEAIKEQDAKITRLEALVEQLTNN